MHAHYRKIGGEKTIIKKNKRAESGEAKAVSV